MRKLITGIDGEGRSCVVEESEVVPAPVEGIPGFAMQSLYRTQQCPPPARPPALAEFVDVQLAPGLLRWAVIDHAPYGAHLEGSTTASLHHTDTVNFVIVQSGTVELLLQAGNRTLEPGDCVVMPGIDHAYRAGPEGCRLVALSVGTPPPTVP
jgi:hypothetical protein